MNNLKGLKWGQLTQDQKDDLMLTATAINGSTGNAPKKSGECIIDFECGLSASGQVEITEDEDVLSVNDDSILYDSQEGAIVD